MPYWSFIEKTCVKQSIKLKWDQNFRWNIPPSRCIWWSRRVLHKVNLTFCRMQLRSADHSQMYPLVEASGSQDQYYIRSTWHSAECNWEGSRQSDVPPSRGIWWSRAVLHKVNLTFWRMQLRRQWTVRCIPMEASSGQEQYYIRSDLHFFAHLMFSSCRGKSYIGIFIGDKSSWTFRNLCILICFVVVFVFVFVTVECCCCCSSVIVDPQLQLNKNNNKSTQ